MSPIAFSAIIQPSAANRQYLKIFKHHITIYQWSTLIKTMKQISERKETRKPTKNTDLSNLRHDHHQLLHAPSGKISLAHVTCTSIPSSCHSAVHQLVHHVDPKARRVVTCLLVWMPPPCFHAQDPCSNPLGFTCAFVAVKQLKVARSGGVKGSEACSSLRTHFAF